MMPKEKRPIKSLWDFIEILRWQGYIGEGISTSTILAITPFFYKLFNFPYNQVFNLEKERLMELGKISINPNTPTEWNKVIAKTTESLRKLGYSRIGKFVTTRGRLVLFPVKKVVKGRVVQLGKSRGLPLEPARVYLPSWFDSRYDRPKRRRRVSR